MSASAVFRRTLLTSARANSLQTIRQPIFHPQSTRAFSYTASKMGGVHNLSSKADFEKARAQPGLMAIDFYATWCGPCKQISPKFLEFSNDSQNSHVRFYKIDVDELSEVAAELSIRAMPTFLFYKDGEQVEEIVGANPKTLEAAVQKHR